MANEKIMEGITVAYFKVLTQYCPIRTKGNQVLQIDL
jgi:hypothetical protein